MGDIVSISNMPGKKQHNAEEAVGPLTSLLEEKFRNKVILDLTQQINPWYMLDAGNFKNKMKVWNP